MDLFAVFHAVLHSPWLLPALVMMIAMDGPVPMLPSETVLMSAAAAAFGSHNVPGIIGLFVAALTGSILGDLLVFGLGRSSNRLLPRAADARGPIARWVRSTIVRRPMVALVGARFVPGGRLVSTAAAGRLGVTLRMFLCGSVLSSALWAVYMLVIGLVVGPVVGGNPLLCVAAGAVMAVLTAGAFTIGTRIRAGWQRRQVPASAGVRSDEPVEPVLVRR